MAWRTEAMPMHALRHCPGDLDAARRTAGAAATVRSRRETVSWANIWS